MTHSIQPRFRPQLVAASALALLMSAGLAHAAGQQHSQAYDQSGQQQTQQDQFGQPQSAAQQDQFGQPQGEQGEMQAGIEQQSQDLLGQPVLSQTGERLGTIQQIVRDPTTQQLSAVIQSEDGQQQVVADMQSLQLEQHAVLSGAQDSLAALPPFQQDQYQVVASADQQDQQQISPDQQEQQALQPEEETQQQDQMALPSDDVIEDEAAPPAG